MSGADLRLDDGWILYSERKPTEAGVYEWRVPSLACKGLIVTIHDHFRLRRAGSESVLSPEFDYWDGHRVLVPAGLQWRPSTKQLNPHTSSPAIPEGVEPEICPFCKQIPRWKSCQRSNYDQSIVICPAPQNLNTWWLECCQWASTPRFHDPRALVEARHKLLCPNETKLG